MHKKQDMTVKQMIQLVSMRIFNLALNKKVNDQKPNPNYLRSLKKYRNLLKMHKGEEATIINEGYTLLQIKPKSVSISNSENFSDLEGTAQKVGEQNEQDK